VGTAVSQLRPSGKARFGEAVIDVISAGEIIEAGQGVRIVRHSGADPVVEAA
jgi:membrane-bound serine protease (ClpP class)